MSDQDCKLFPHHHRSQSPPSLQITTNRQNLLNSTSIQEKATATMDDFDMGLLDDTEYMKTVLRQKMLGIAPVFLYRVPKEKAPGVEYL